MSRYHVLIRQCEVGVRHALGSCRMVEDCGLRGDAVLHPSEAALR
jgi:hypothetical protein